MPEVLDPWYDEKYRQRRHERVFSTLSTLRNQQQHRLRWLEIYRALYDDDECNGYEANVARSMQSARSGRSRFSENLIRSVIDTVCAKTGKNSPKPFCCSNGGDGALRRKGKGLNKFLLGKFDQLKVSNLLRTILRDACIVGTGALKIMVDYATHDIGVERTNIAQLFVDPSECQFGAQPTQMFQVIPGNKQLLMKLYPKQAASIKNAAPPEYTNLSQRRPKAVLVEQCEVIEGWKLPDEPGKPGKHTICVSNATLVDEDWEDADFPFVFLHYNEPGTGFWGTGLAAMLLEIQYRVNWTLLNIQQNIQLTSRPTWMVPQTANVPPAHFNTRGIGDVKVLYYKGQAAPVLAKFDSTSQEVFQWLADQRQRAYEIAGVSQLSATSQKPPGDLSGVALDSLNDIESERFIMVGKAYEQCSMDVAERLIAITAAEWKKRNEDSEVSDAMFKAFYSRSWELSEIKWSEVNMKRDQFNLSIFPMSSLPNSIAGRQQKIQDYMQQGMIPADVARELLDFPDYQRWSDLQEAAHDNAERLVESVLYDGADPVVEKYHDVNYMLQYCQNLYNQAQIQDADEDKLERLRQLMDQCQEFMDAAQQAAQANQPPAPPAAPTPTQGQPMQ